MKGPVSGLLIVLGVSLLGGCLQMKEDPFDVSISPETAEVHLNEWINLTVLVKSRGFSGRIQVPPMGPLRVLPENLTYSYTIYGPMTPDYAIKANETLEIEYSIMWELGTDENTGRVHSLSNPITVDLQLKMVGHEEGKLPIESGIWVKSNVVTITILPP